MSSRIVLLKRRQYQRASGAFAMAFSCLLIADISPDEAFKRATLICRIDILQAGRDLRG